MSTLEGIAAPTVWDELVDLMGVVVAQQFLAKFDRPIRVEYRDVDMPDGGRVKEYRFRHEKPGLMGTAQEHMFFNSFIDGYRTCFNLAIERIVPPEGERVS